MNSKSEYLVDSIFKKLKDYKSREISLKKEGPDNCGAFKKGNNLVIYLRSIIFLV